AWPRCFFHHGATNRRVCVTNQIHRVTLGVIGAGSARRPARSCHARRRAALLSGAARTRDYRADPRCPGQRSSARAQPWRGEERQPVRVPLAITPPQTVQPQPRGVATRGEKAMGESNRSVKRWSRGVCEHGPVLAAQALVVCLLALLIGRLWYLQVPMGE